MAFGKLSFGRNQTAMRRIQIANLYLVVIRSITDRDIQVIRNFKGKFASAIWIERRTPKGFPSNISGVARRKLAQVNAASALSDLLTPPGNRLEALKGDLRGWHSVRINEQWRLIFRWTDYGPEDVEIIDYH